MTVILYTRIILSRNDRNRYRTTKDIDFLKTGNAEADFLHAAIQEIAAVPYPEDGVHFDLDSVTLSDIREAQQYQGQRAKVTAHIGKTRVVLQLDIGVGDAVTPSATTITIPALLNQAPPEISAYPIETIIAEKLEAIVSIGLITSRMKDFYDLYVITKTMPLTINTVRDAVYATFKRRGTPIPSEIPEVLSDSMSQNSAKQAQWKAFINKIQSDNANISLETTLEQIRGLAASLFISKERS